MHSTVYSISTHLFASNAVQQLQQDSGIEVESGTVEEFRHAILSGDFAAAEQLSSTLPLIQSQNNTDRVKFLIREQMFLELLEGKHTMEALHVLRHELTPLGQDVDRLHQLSR